MAKPEADIVILSDAERPKYWFITTISVKDRIQTRLLPGQFVPVASTNPRKTGSEYMPGNVNLMVNSPKDKRSKFPIGAVFAVDAMESDLSFYKCTSANMACVSEFDEDATEEMQTAYRLYKMRIALGVDDPDTTSSTKTEKPAGASYLQRLKVNDKLRPPTIETDNFYVDPDIWYLMLRNIKRGEHMVLIGPTGAGKTVIAQFLANVLGRKDKFFYYNLGGMQDPSAGLLGVNRLQVVDGKTVSNFDLAPFAQQLGTPEAIFLWDEISRMPWQGSNILFPVLDKEQNRLPLDLAATGEQREIRLGEGSVVIATANLGAEYTGTIPIDRALRDRLFTVNLDYLPADQEILLLQSLYGINKVQAGQIVVIANAIRQGYKNGTLSAGISTRYTKQAASLVADGWDVLPAVKICFLTLFEGTDTEGDRATVLTTITSR